MYVRMCVARYLHNFILFKSFLAPTPKILLRYSYFQQGTYGEPNDLVCTIALSSTIQSLSVNLSWNYANNDTRVRVIPTTIATNDSIDVIYTTVIQFNYLVEEDEGNYTCSLAIDGDTEESSFDLKIISKYQCYNPYHGY